MLKVRVSIELLTRFLTQGHEVGKTVVEEGLPPGCMLAMASYHHNAGEIVFYFEEREPVKNIIDKTITVRTVG